MLKTPPLQTATATIDTLCGRLQSATLLEDRRAAILGLRSFAKQFPASVASGSLRELIATLRRDGLGEVSVGKKQQEGETRRSQDGGDVDTIRLILETLLMLFNPDSTSPEAGDEIAYFMADEFAMRQDNVTLLLSMLDPASPFADYYSRLYSVQLLSAICAARLERLQECILSAPLGVSRLVGVLDDGRDAVRNAGLLLLVELTSGANEELRKIVAFDDVFGKIFALIRLEGGLSEAGIVAQDCLTLLANLIRGSSSNQTMFRESGCVPLLIELLSQAFPPENQEAVFVTQNREKATWGMLQLVQLFAFAGEASTAQNQVTFFRAGATQVLCDIGFAPAIPFPIRAAALKATSALIENNQPIQEQFAGSQVITPSDADYNVQEIQKAGKVNGTRANVSNVRSVRASLEIRRTYIIEALLDLALNQPQSESLLRVSACGLIQAYLRGHDRIKSHFLQRAIAGHSEHETAANVLIVLLHPSEADEASTVLASWIIQDLVVDNPDAKDLLAAVKEGNESEGEDVVTSIQALSSQLQAALQQTPPNESRSIAYASSLSTLLWDFAAGVDNFLIEGSSLVQALIHVVRAPVASPIVTGLAATLLGIVYEFSTKDSPISRRTLAPLLQQKLGRFKYIDALSRLRRDPAVRDFELNREVDDSDEISLSEVFVELFASEYSRLRKAIDKDPGVEVLPQSAAEAGVDRDILDELRQQAQAAKDALAESQQEVQSERQKSEQNHMAITKDLQSAQAEVERMRKINQGMQKGHDNELDKLVKQHEQLTKQHEQSRQSLEGQHKRALADAKQEGERQTQAALREREHQNQAVLRERDVAAAQKGQEYERRLAELGNSHRSEASGHAAVRQQMETLQSKHNDVLLRERDLSRQAEDLQRKHLGATRELQTTQARASNIESELEKLRKLHTARTEEVERLNSQANELKEELKSREEELKTERAGFADLEKELEAAKAASASATTESTNADAERNLAKLRSELDLAKESEKNAREELESMLLVTSDIEAKRDEYRSKVKELGGDVSDDDEDEDDDEEADEEENDDVD